METGATFPRGQVPPDDDTFDTHSLAAPPHALGFGTSEAGIADEKSCSCRVFAADARRNHVNTAEGAAAYSEALVRSCWGAPAAGCSRDCTRLFFPAQSSSFKDFSCGKSLGRSSCHARATCGPTRSGAAL